MTPKPIDYSKTIIYKIVCNDLDITDCYVGQTTNFKSRKRLHKCDCNNEKRNHIKIYKSIRENGGWENWSMIEIEKYPCNDGNEARKRERYWFEELKANLNSDVPCRTQKEHYEDNKDKIKEYQKTHKEQRKEWYEKNRDKIVERQRIYNEKNKEYYKERNKEYREKNRDKIKEYKKEYHEKNKDKIKEYKKEYYARSKNENNIYI